MESPLSGHHGAICPLQCQKASGLTGCVRFTGPCGGERDGSAQRVRDAQRRALSATDRAKTSVARATKVKKGAVQDEASRTVRSEVFTVSETTLEEPRSPNTFTT